MQWARGRADRPRLAGGASIGSTADGRDAHPYLKADTRTSRDAGPYLGWLGQHAVLPLPEAGHLTEAEGRACHAGPA